MYLVSGWCLSNFGASLQALNPDITHITSYRNVISDIFIVSWRDLPFRERQNFIQFRERAMGTRLECTSKSQVGVYFKVTK